MGADNKREEGADFNDYLGIPWTYGSVVDRPEPAQLGSLDCSGFQRMVWGYRNGLSLDLSSSGGSLSRRAYQIYNSGPGIIILPDTKRQITDFSHIQVGDVAFLDVDSIDGTQIDHMGIYFGVDSQGHHRFLSSRKTANGPTFGDIDGQSVLDGNAYFAQRFRAVRRF
jgi:cell wall-associated NlpC family hydrolase